RPPAGHGVRARRLGRREGAAGRGQRHRGGGRVGPRYGQARPPPGGVAGGGAGGGGGPPHPRRAAPGCPRPRGRPPPRAPGQGGRPEQPFEGEIALLDPTTPRWLRSFASSGHQYALTTAASPDGRTLYATFDTCEVTAFEVATGKARRSFSGHASFVGSLAVSPDG